MVEKRKLSVLSVPDEVDLEDTKLVFRIRKSMKDRHTMAKSKRTKHDLPIFTYKTKDRVMQNPLQTGGELM